MKVFDDIRESIRNNRSQFYRDLAMPFYGYNRPGAKPSQGIIESFWLQGMLGGHKAQCDCVKAFSETDFTNDLREIDIHVRRQCRPYRSRAAVRTMMAYPARVVGSLNSAWVTNPKRR